jgi:dolichyl-diphosphooligosaccharide--protein glycosyltransferase
VVSLLIVFLVVCGLNFLVVSSFTDQVTYDDHEYEAVVAIEEHADQVDRSNHPENYVLSDWGHNRMYNYFVSGEGRSYAYANSNYDDFRSGTDPDGWFDEFDDEVGYVVLNDVGGDVPAESAQARLHHNLGVETDDHDALEHYQLIYISEDWSVTAFAVVPGATIEGAGEPGDTVTAETTVPIEGELVESITYTQDAVVDEEGTYQLTVAYSGTYAINGEDVEVSERNILNGETVSVDDPNDDDSDESASVQ